MNDIQKRVEALEKTLGPGEFGKRAEEIVYSTSVTEGGLTALGETWERRQGESDDALRKRAAGELLKNDKRTLIIKTCQNTARLMRERTYGHVETNLDA